jgi:hypothetical protein
MVVTSSDIFAKSYLIHIIYGHNVMKRKTALETCLLIPGIPFINFMTIAKSSLKHIVHSYIA